MTVGRASASSRVRPLPEKTLIKHSRVRASSILRRRWSCWGRQSATARRAFIDRPRETIHRTPFGSHGSWLNDGSVQRTNVQERSVDSRRPTPATQPCGLALLPPLSTARSQAPGRVADLILRALWRSAYRSLTACHAAPGFVGAVSVSKHEHGGNVEACRPASSSSRELPIRLGSGASSPAESLAASVVGE